MPVQTEWKQNIRGLVDPMAARIIERIQSMIGALSQELATLTKRLDALPVQTVSTPACNCPKGHVDILNDPAMSDDSSQGYEVNSLWTNQRTPQSFICVDATLGAANWLTIT